MNINQNRLTDTFLQLTAIDNPSLDERAMADEIERRLTKLGISWTEDDSRKKTGGNAGNIFARAEGTIPGPAVLFSAHMDSVQPASGKRAAVHADGTITGDGTTVLGADDLAGVAEILEMLQCLKESGTPHRTIELLITAAEELYDVGSEFFDYSQITAKEAYVLDSSGETGTFLYKAPSIISFEFQIHGTAAHAGFNPELGVHAIAIAAAAIQNVKMGHVDEETTVNIGEISGGAGTNIVPELCTVKGEIRSYRHEKALKQLGQLEEIFAHAAKEYRGSITTKNRIALIAYETPENSRCIRNYRTVCEKLGYPFDPQESFGGSDNNGLAAHGIEGIVLACGMQNVHSTKEYSTVKSLTETTQALLELVCLQQ